MNGGRSWRPRQLAIGTGASTTGKRLPIQKSILDARDGDGSESINLSRRNHASSGACSSPKTSSSPGVIAGPAGLMVSPFLSRMGEKLSDEHSFVPILVVPSLGDGSAPVEGLPSATVGRLAAQWMRITHSLPAVGLLYLATFAAWAFTVRKFTESAESVELEE